MPEPFDVSVNRRFVHKRAVSEVLLTASRQESSGLVTVWAQWPRRHWYFGRPEHELSAVLVAETTRQLCLLVGTCHLDLPIDVPLVITDLRLTDIAYCTATQRAPANIVIAVTVKTDQDQKQRVRSVRISATFHDQEHLMARAEGTATVIPYLAYQRLRRLALQTPCLSSKHCFRIRSQTTTWDDLADLHHPVFFDHPTDHLPRMLLIDTSIRIGQELTDQSHVSSLTAEFHNFLDLDSRSDVIVHTGATSRDADSVTATYSQDVLGATITTWHTGNVYEQP